jgi:hypothetical protein
MRKGVKVDDLAQTFLKIDLAPPFQKVDFKRWIGRKTIH